MAQEGSSILLGKVKSCGVERLWHLNEFEGLVNAAIKMFG